MCGGVYYIGGDVTQGGRISVWWTGGVYVNLGH